MEAFYKTFEDSFRGSRELILERLKVYLLLVKIIKGIYPDASAVDLGCGRGEWLELLNANQIDAIGVDINNDMVNFSQSLGLKVILNDALNYLKTLQDNTVYIVSGFHIAEHLSFDYLYELIKESHRVLKPSGILILETPNPENIKVATLNFYLDPTHIRPIPPMLASFLFSNCGFGRTKIMRLQEDKTLFEEHSTKISELIDGVSPDYSIVGQKSDRSETLSLFDSFFMKEYGITQEALEQKFDNRLAQSEQRLAQTEQTQTLLSEQIHQFQKEYKITQEALEQKFDNRLAQSEQRLAQTEQKINKFYAYTEALNKQLIDITNSRSWRITKPLRSFGEFARWFVRGSIAWVAFKPQSRPRRTLRQLLIKVKEKLHKHKHAKNLILVFLKSFPKLKERLSRVGKTHTVTVPIFYPDDLSPRAKKIYKKLKNAIDKKEI